MSRERTPATIAPDLDRAIRQLATLSERTRQLETEREAQAVRETILSREREAYLREVTELRQTTAELATRLDASQIALKNTQDRLTDFQSRLLARFRQQETLEKERRGLSALLGRTVLALLGCRPETKPSKRRLAHGIKLLAQTYLVDVDWYRENNKDVAAAGMDPVQHYLCHGAAEGRDPRDPTLPLPKTS